MNTLKYFFFLILGGILPSLSAQTINSDIDYEKFLSNHDMVWNMVPDSWQLSPFSGNGNVGFLFYQTEGEAKNTMSLHVDMIIMTIELHQKKSNCYGFIEGDCLWGILILLQKELSQE